MSFIKTQEIFHKWINQNEKYKFKIRLGIYTERMLNMNNLNKYVYYLISTYLFIYEFQKHYEILELNFFKNRGIQLNSMIALVVNNLVLENHINHLIKIGESTIVVISILIIQFLLYVYNFIQLFSENKFEMKQKTNSIHISIHNLFNVILLIFPYSLNYINLSILSNQDFSNNTNIFIFIFNLFNFICFNIFYMIYLFLYNDVSPIQNKFFFSSSKPSFHIITYFKFILYNIFLLFLNNMPGYIVVCFIILFFIFYIFFILARIFIINYVFYLITLYKTMFFLNLYIFNLFYFPIKRDTQGKNQFYEIFLLLFSIMITFVLFPSISKFRNRFMYKLNKYNRISDNEFENDESYAYYLFSIRELSHSDLFKHQYICNNFKSSEECICKTDISTKLNNLDIINELREKTFLILSKLRKRPSIFDLMYLQSHLMNNKINHTLFLFLMRFRIKHLKGYRFHFILRIVKNFIKLYQKFYDTNLNTEFNKSIFTLETLNLIILYEYTLRSFLKKIKQVINSSERFWEVIKIKPINYENFLKYGFEISENTLIICQEYGIMEKVQSKQIKLLKIYAYFIKSVIGDQEYVQYLLGQINNNIQTHILSVHDYSTFTDKDFGLLIISGQSKTLFKVLSYNKFSKNFFGIKSNLKNRDIHHFQPFPFNLYHIQYLKHRFSISYLSKERALFCINDQGDLNYITTNTVPCLNLEGNINFFMTFYISMEDSNKMIALVDKNGCVFSATKSFKYQFNLSINCSFSENSELFDTYQSYLNKDNILNLDFLEMVNSKEHTRIYFPYIHDYIMESKKIFNKKTLTSFKKLSHMNLSNLKENIGSPISSKKYSKPLIFNYSYNKLSTKGNLDQLFSKSNHSSLKLDKLSGSIKINHNDEKEKKYETTEMFKTIISREIEMSKEISCISELPYENSENIVFQSLIWRQRTKFNLKILDKKIISGLFNFYLFEVKKVVEKLKSKNNLKPDFLLDHAKTAKFQISDEALETENYVQNKINLDSFLINYETNNIDIYSLSKVFKKIYFLLILIFLLLIMVYSDGTIYNLLSNSQYLKNFEISNGFLFIRTKIFMIITNAEFIHKLRLIFKLGNVINYDKRSEFLKKYIINDITSLNNFIQDFILTDLSDYPTIDKLVHSPNLRLNFLNENNTYTFQNYSLYEGLNIFFLELKEFISDEDSFINNIDLNFFNNSTNILKSNYGKRFEFIFSNYFNFIIRYLQDITQVKYDDYNHKTQTIFKWLQINIYAIIVLFVTITILICLIIRIIYVIHKSLIKFYLYPQNEFIQNKLNLLKKVKSVIYNLKNDNKYLDLLKDNVQSNPQLKNNKEIKRFSFNPRKSFLINSIQTSNNKDKVNTITSLYSLCNTESNLLKNELNPQKVLITNNEEQNNEYLETKIIEKENYSPTQTNSITNSKYYFQLFFRGLILQFSFLYIFIILLQIHPHIRDVIDQLTTAHFNLIYKTESEFLLVSSFLYISFKNSTLQDISKDDIYQEYSDLFLTYHYNLSLYNYGLFQDEIKTKLNMYNSEKLCKLIENENKENITQKPSMPFEDCSKSPISSGIQIYVLKLRNLINNLYKNFKYEKNRTTQFFLSLLNDSNIEFSEFSLNYYIRTFFLNIETTYKEFYEKKIQLSVWVSIGIFLLFTLHVTIFIYITFFVISKRVYFYFEKIRILLLILPVNEFDNGNKLRRFMKKYY